MIQPTQNVKKQWKNRVIAEYCSAAISAELLHWSIQLGLSPDIVWKTEQVTREEITHSELSNQVYDLACGGFPTPPNINPKSLQINHAPQAPLHFRAATFVADFFCIGECLGHPLFKKMLEDCTVKQAKKALEIICKDEKTHGEFGFIYLSELLPRLQKPEIKALEKDISEYLAKYSKIYDTQFKVSEDERAWGLISGPEHQEIVLDKIENLVKPNFIAVFGKG